MNTPGHCRVLQHISSLGDVILVSHVIVQAENSEKKERLFVLFHGALVMLSTSAQLNTYTYEVRVLNTYTNKIFCTVYFRTYTV